MRTYPAQKLEKAVDQAEILFWKSIARSFEEATTTACPVEIEMNLRSHMTEAVQIWLRYNLGEEE